MTWPRASPTRQPPRAVDHRDRVRACSRGSPSGAAQIAGLPLRRRAADARDRPRADGQSARAADGRAVRRPRAADRRRGDGDHPQAQGERTVDRAGGAEPEARVRHRRRHRHPQQRPRRRGIDRRPSSHATASICASIWEFSDRSHNARAMEQVRPDGGAQARQARARGAAEERHRRHPFPRRRAARGRIRQAASRHRDDAAGAFRRRRDQGAQPKQEADIRDAHPATTKRLADLDAMGVDMQVVCPPPPQCYYTVPLDIAVEGHAHVINDGIAEYVGRQARPAGRRSAACRCRTATRRPRSSSAA